MAKHRKPAHGGPVHAFKNDAEEEEFKRQLRKVFHDALTGKNAVTKIADDFSGIVLEGYWEDDEIDHLTNPIGERIFAAIEVAVEEAANAAIRGFKAEKSTQRPKSRLRSRR